MNNRSGTNIVGTVSSRLWAQVCCSIASGPIGCSEENEQEEAEEDQTTMIPWDSHIAPACYFPGRSREKDRCWKEEERIEAGPPIPAGSHRPKAEAAAAAAEQARLQQDLDQMKACTSSRPFLRSSFCPLLHMFALVLATWSPPRSYLALSSSQPIRKSGSHR